MTSTTSTALPWRSGISADSVTDAASWAAFRGRAVDAIVVYPYRGAGWDEVVDPVDLWGRLAGYEGLVVASVPFWPENDDNPVNLAHCAAGYYVEQWKRFGASLVQAGRADSIVRIAWEANGTWFQWRASDPATWRRAFQVTADAVRAGNPAARIEWSVNNHYSQLPADTHDAFDLYPGDAYVDIVGMSAYDHYPPSPNEADWDAQFNGDGGLAALIRFAAAHGKQFSVSEWGVAQESAGGGGDNTFYLQKMFDVFSFFRASLAYEAYFDSADPANILSSLVTPGLNPRCAALYRDLWGSVH